MVWIDGRLMAVSQSLLLMALLLLPPSSAGAQIVNVQSLLLKDSKEGLTLGLSLTGDLRRGNVEYLKASAGSLAYLKHDAHNIVATARMDYASKEEQSFIKESFAHLRWRWWVWKKLGVEAFVQHGYKPFSRIQGRFLVGAGVPFTMHRSSGWLVSGGLDWMYETDTYSEDDQYEDSGRVYTYHRLDAFLTLVWTPSKVKLITTVYYQPVLTDWSNVRFLADGSLMFPLSKRIAFTLNSTYSHDTVSPEGTSAYDFRFMWGLVGTVGPFFGK